MWWLEIGMPDQWRISGWGNHYNFMRCTWWYQSSYDSVDVVLVPIGLHVIRAIIWHHLSYLGQWFSWGRSYICTTESRPPHGHNLGDDACKRVSYKRNGCYLDVNKVVDVACAFPPHHDCGMAISRGSHCDGEPRRKVGLHSFPRLWILEKNTGQVCSFTDTLSKQDETFFFKQIGGPAEIHPSSREDRLRSTRSKTFSSESECQSL
jgi:hypothetical protein